MSTPENNDARGRLLTYLFWGGISLAPLAALLLIVAGSSATGLRFAALLAILAVVAIGLSVTLRRDVTSMKLDIEETLLDEIDMLRNDVRADITTAARATHRALSEKMAHLHESVDQVRRQVDSAQFLELDRPPAPPAVTAGPPRRPAVGAAAPPGVVQRTETVRVTTRTIVDPDEEPGHPRANGARPALPHAPREEADHGGRGHREWDEPRPPARPALPASDDSWPEQRVARNDFEVAARQAWRGQSDEDPGDDPRWTGMRGGDRWAEVRHDERGRELRMGERRTAIRTDETGTQMRIVDRWSSVREERPRHEASPATFENTGETRAQRRAREEADHDGRAALPSAEHLHQRDEPWRDDSRRVDSRRDDSPRDGHRWDEPRRSATRDDRDDREDRNIRDDRNNRDDRDDRPHRDDRRYWDAPDDRGVHGDRDSRPVRANGHDDRGKLERDAMRDSGFIPRPLDQRRRDDHGYSHEVERIPAQRAAERYEEPRSRRDRDHREDRHDTGERPGRSTSGEWSANGDRHDHDDRGHQRDRGDRGDRADRAPEPPIRRRGGAGRPSGGAQEGGAREGGARELAGSAREAVAGPRETPGTRDSGHRASPGDGQWPPATGSRQQPSQQRDRGDDNRWEREPSGQRSQMRRAYDFEVNDERWR